MAKNDRIAQRTITVEGFKIEPESSNTKNRIGTIDLIAHDPKTDEVVLAMNEPGEWDGSEERLLDLQDRFNAYASFLLDGEFAEAHPDLVGKRVRIEVRCERMPDASALELLGMIHDQLAFQEIRMEVVVADGGRQGAAVSSPPT